MAATKSKIDWEHVIATFDKAHVFKQAWIHRNRKEAIFALATFYDGVLKILPAGKFEVFVKGPWFDPSNKRSKTPDAIEYRLVVRA